MAYRISGIRGKVLAQYPLDLRCIKWTIVAKRNRAFGQSHTASYAKVEQYRCRVPEPTCFSFPSLNRDPNRRITRKCTGATGRLFLEAKPKRRRPVISTVRQGIRTRTQCNGTRTRTRKDR